MSGDLTGLCLNMCTRLFLLCEICHSVHWFYWSDCSFNFMSGCVDFLGQSIAGTLVLYHKVLFFCCWLLAPLDSPILTLSQTLCPVHCFLLVHFQYEFQSAIEVILKITNHLYLNECMFKSWEFEGKTLTQQFFFDSWGYFYWHYFFLGPFLKKV